MAVEWLPIRDGKSLLGEIAIDEAWAVVDIPIRRLEADEPYDPGVIVNGWLDVTMAMPDGTAMGGGFGPVEILLGIKSAFSTSWTASELSSVNGMKKWEDYLWVRSIAFVAGTTSLIHWRIDLNTMRRFKKGDYLSIVLYNGTGALLGKAGVHVKVYGELYLRED